MHNIVFVIRGEPVEIQLDFIPREGDQIYFGDQLSVVQGTAFQIDLQTKKTTVICELIE